MDYVSLDEVQRLPVSQFTAENSFFYCMQPIVIRTVQGGKRHVESDWKIVGWNPLTGSHLSRENCIAVMLENKQEDLLLWQHMVSPGKRDKQILRKSDVLESSLVEPTQ